MTKNDYLAGLALGVLLGSLFMTVIFWAFDIHRDYLEANLVGFLGVFAPIIAALFALRGISNQIQSNNDHSESVRKAKLDSSISMLPIVLSNICDISKARYYSVAFGIGAQPEGRKWEFDQLELSVLRDSIEFSDGRPKKIIRNIIRSYQVLTARWDERDWVNLFEAEALDAGHHHLILRYNQFSMITGWAALYALSSALFEFARGQQNVSSDEEIIDNVISILQRMDSGGYEGRGGLMLRNNSNYSDHVDRIIEKRKIEFIGEEYWTSR